MAIAVVVGLIAAGMALAGSGQRLLAGLCGGLGLGPVAFFVTGAMVARTTGIGSFCSLPFGLTHCTDLDLCLSVLTWVLVGALPFVLFAQASARRRSIQEGEAP